jgi:hypothetical protein
MVRDNLLCFLSQIFSDRPDAAEIKLIPEDRTEPIGEQNDADNHGEGQLVRVGVAERAKREAGEGKKGKKVREKPKKADPFARERAKYLAEKEERERQAKVCDDGTLYFVVLGHQRQIMAAEKSHFRSVICRRKNGGGILCRHYGTIHIYMFCRCPWAQELQEHRRQRLEQLNQSRHRRAEQVWILLRANEKPETPRNLDAVRRRNHTKNPSVTSQLAVSEDSISKKPR